MPFHPFFNFVSGLLIKFQFFHYALFDFNSKKQYFSLILLELHLLLLQGIYYFELYIRFLLKFRIQLQYFLQYLAKYFEYMIENIYWAQISSLICSDIKLLFLTNLKFLQLFSQSSNLKEKWNSKFNVNPSTQDNVLFTTTGYTCYACTN